MATSCPIHLTRSVNNIGTAGPTRGSRSHDGCSAHRLQWMVLAIGLVAHVIRGANAAVASPLQQTLAAATSSRTLPLHWLFSATAEGCPWCTDFNTLIPLGLCSADSQ